MIRKTLLRFLLSTVLLIVFLPNGKAVGPAIGLALVNYSINQEGEPTHANTGLVLSIRAQVTNTDSNSIYVGPIDFMVYHDGNEDLSQEDHLFSKPGYSGTIITLQPLESVPANFNLHLDPQYFKPGPDVVVVWPVLGGGSGTVSHFIDSVAISLNIVTTGIDDAKNSSFSYIIQNDKILLLTPGTITSFNQVRIYDVLGEQVSVLQAQNITEIPLPNLPKGMYLCQMTSTDGRIKVIKFIH